MDTARYFGWEWVFIFTTVFEIQILSRVLRTSCPWDLLYADDMIISAEPMEELMFKVKT